MSAVIAALAAALLAVVGMSPVAGSADRSAPRIAAEEQALLRRLRSPLVALAVVAGWTLLGGWPGVGAGLVAALVGWRVLGRVESPAVARRRDALERDLPMAVHLLGAALRAGASPTGAVRAVADALPGPVADEFASTHHRLQLGLDPVAAWRCVDGPLRPLGQAMVRAHESGASVLTAVEGLSEELRDSSRARREALARTVEVRAAAPLGLCFLPAFVLMGIVPMTVGIFASLRLFG